MSETTHNKGLLVHGIYVGIIVILLIAIVGVYHHYHEEVAGLRANMALRPRMMGMGSMGMLAVTPAPLTDQQKKQLTMGTDTTTTQKTFDINGGNFYFSPNKITVNKGDSVTITFTNDGGFHDFVIDELSVKTPVIMTGKTATVTFTASKAGTYQFYCSLPGHRAKGMVGTLIVQ